MIKFFLLFVQGNVFFHYMKFLFRIYLVLFINYKLKGKNNYFKIKLIYYLLFCFLFLKSSIVLKDLNFRIKYSQRYPVIIKTKLNVNTDAQYNYFYIIFKYGYYYIGVH